MPDTKVVTPSTQNFLALPVGTVIGRYRITGILGQGSFGITYRAHDDQLGRDVAIKEYLPTTFAIRHGGLSVVPNSTGAAEDFAWGRQRFVEEGRTLAGFQRAPGIVRVHDFLEANGTAYIVMELVQGETLGARLQRQGRLAVPEVERILRALLAGLEKVHAASFIHRDIKPDNILLDDEGQPTLIDFGAARAAVAGRTSALTGIFTPGYAAVEQFTDGRQGPFTDIYGLSAVLFQAITGEKPPSAIDRVLDDTFVPLAKRRPAGFAPALLVGIDRGMEIRPEARPQSIAAWRTLLFPGETPDKPIPSKVPEKPGRWRIAAVAGLAAMLVAGAAAGALFLFSPQKAPVTDADRQQAGARLRPRTPRSGGPRKRRSGGRWPPRSSVPRKRHSAKRRLSPRPPRSNAPRRIPAAAPRSRRAGRLSPMPRGGGGEGGVRRRQVAAVEAQRKADEDARAAAAAEESRRQAAEVEQREAARQLAEREARERKFARRRSRRIMHATPRPMPRRPRPRRRLSTARRRKRPKPGSISVRLIASGFRWRSPPRASTRAAPMGCSVLARAR